jgi:hypothetical protein
MAATLLFYVLEPLNHRVGMMVYMMTYGPSFTIPSRTKLDFPRYIPGLVCLATTS